MKTLQEMIDVMTAFSKNTKIQSKGQSYSEWHDCPDPSWDWANFDYRVKPEPPKPREWWIQLDRDSGYAMGVYTQKFVAFGKTESVHVKEVL